MAKVQAAPSDDLGPMVDNKPEPLLVPPKTAEKTESIEKTEEEIGWVTDDDEEMEEEELELSQDEEGQPAPTKEQDRENHVSDESLELNRAFEALETMRKANLEVEFGGKAIPDVNLLHDYCTACLYENKEREDQKIKRLSQNEAYMSNPNREKRRMWAKQMMTRLRTQRKSPPCMICSSPVCAKHRCKEFQKEKINVCCKCSNLFTMDFVVTTMASSTEQEQRRRSIAHMVDSYDRALLILRYSAQYIDEIAEALETNSKMNDHVGLGSSTVGLMSGLTGVAAVTAQFVAAAAVLSPAGPPLVVASILFGASAAAASGGTEAVNYYSEPNQLACKIIALHDLVHSLVGVSKVLKSALNQGHIDPEHYTDMKPDKTLSSYWKSRAPELSTASVVETVMEEDEDIEEFVEEPKADENTQDEKAPTDVVEESKPVEQPKKTEDPKPETGPTYYSLSEIDGDCDEPVCDDKKDAETSVTESSSFESEDEQEKNMASEEVEPTATSTTAVPVTPTEGEETGTPEKPTTRRPTFASASRVSEGAATALLMSAVARRAGFGFITPQQATPTATNEPPSSSTELVEHTSTDIVAPSNQRTAFTRTLTNSMKLAAFASIACCMLSAATIVMETKNLQDTLENMRRGSPCEKAAQLRKIRKEIENLPDTREIAEGWEAYMQEAANQEKSK